MLLATTALLLAGPAVQTATAEDAALDTVNKVDLERYAGRWHEVARIPNRFQRSCARGTTAQYKLRDDGRIGVTNSCIKKNGKVKEASGVARIVAPESNAKLEVSFVRLFGKHIFWGDYWIIGLDDDYQWVVVGHPKRKYGWVLARTPTLDKATLERVFTLVERNGYSRDAFEVSAP